MGKTLKDILGDSYSDDLTAEQLGNLIIPIIDDLQGKAEKAKKSQDTAASQAAEYKKQLEAKQTDEERANAEAKKQLDDLIAERDQLKREVSINKFAKNYLAQGYDEELANDTAKALADGDYDKVFKNGNKFLAAQLAKKDADALKETPTHEGGEAQQKGVSYEDYLKMKYDARAALKESNPTLWAEYNTRDISEQK